MICSPYWDMSNSNQETFAGIPPELSSFEQSNILLQPIPYDGTSTYRKGASNGFDAFFQAALNMELYDIETDSEVFTRGIHILEPLLEKQSPEAVYKVVYRRTKELLKTEKFLTFYGGEHSISIGIIKAFYEKWKNITILQLDAHADLRPDYNGSKFNHACALYDASQRTRLVQVGIRSMDKLEKKFLQPGNVFYDHELDQGENWIEKVLSRIMSPVYITLDMDVLDPAIFPSTGTPEPGGLNWYSLTRFLRVVFSHFLVVGFDMVEHAPLPGFASPDFLAAKLYYKMLSYKFSD
jgi:agmatinase